MAAFNQTEVDNNTNYFFKNSSNLNFLNSDDFKDYSTHETVINNEFASNGSFDAAFVSDIASQWCPNTFLMQLKPLPCIFYSVLALLGLFLCFFGEFFIQNYC